MSSESSESLDSESESVDLEEEARDKFDPSEGFSKLIRSPL